MAALGLAVVVAGSLSALADSGLKILPGHLAPAIHHLKPQADLDSSNVLTLAIGLPLRNTGALSSLLQRIYDPASPDYHHYLTTGEFTAKFGPTTNDYEAVCAFARSNGFVIIRTHPNRMLVDVRAGVPDIQRAFHVKMKTYRHPFEPRDFFAPDADPSVDPSLPVAHVAGLENFGTKTNGLHATRLISSAKSVSGVGTGPAGLYEGQDFRTAYVPGTTLTGAGQNVALVQLDDYFDSDIAAYAAQIGLANPPAVVRIPVDGGNPGPQSFNGNLECSLDIEMELAMAPGLSNVFVYEGPSVPVTSLSVEFEDIYNKIANDNSAKQVSSSWGIGFATPDPVAEQIFEQMAIQGQAFFQCSFDNDAYTNTSVVPFPADSPHLTVVGGTGLATRRDQTYLSESVWNDTSDGQDGIGSCGGISTNYAIPSWQTNINMSTNLGSPTVRNIPDVALVASNIFIFALGGSGFDEEGTSAATPLWAGYLALANQQAQINGVAPVGFLNPVLYSFLGTPAYTNYFHDITTGNNEWSGSPNLYSAVPGYDLCTGLGTINGTNLINYFASGAVSPTITHISPPPKPYGSAFTNLYVGNPNGTWNLFTMDDQALSSGIISNGWTLTLVSGDPVGFSGDNGVSVTASSTNVSVATGIFTYYLTETNYGPSASAKVGVTVTLPTGVTLLSSNITAGTLGQGTLGLTWSFSNLPTNSGGALSFTVQAASAGTYTASASVTANTADENPDDDSASISVVVGTTTPPALSGITVGSGHNFQMNIASGAGQTNVVQASTNLSKPNGWVPVMTNVGPFTFHDLQSTNYPVRFYRDVITGP